MKNFWKWILGIVVILVVLFGLGVGSRLLMRSFLPEATTGVADFTRPMMLRVEGTGEISELGRPFVVGSGEVQSFASPMLFGSSGYGGCPMSYHGRSFMHLGWLVPLALLGLLVYGAYRWGFRKAQAPVASTVPAALRTCPKCGNQVQDGWSNCANCGRKL